MQFILISDNNVITVLGYGLNEAEVFENGLIKINKNCNFENLDLARYGSDATQAIKYGVFMGKEAVKDSNIGIYSGMDEDKLKKTDEKE